MDEVLQITYRVGTGDVSDVHWSPFTDDEQADSLYEAEKQIDAKVAEWVTSLEADGAKDTRVTRFRKTLGTHEHFEAHISYILHGLVFNDSLQVEVRPQPE